MPSWLRDAPAGQLIRAITGNKYLQYPEEMPGFQLPQAWQGALSGDTTGASSRNSSSAEDAPAAPTVTENGQLMVDWYSADDADN
ncbi:hypothetical protein FOCG_16752 [Fusarium oxysporum f. sp. radicis-lycopersici 26381]|nr:hypothetical protein FOCG_16752 [Fusarium oxysporum f. sp. radicis-lycopersici 26381]